MNRKTKEFVNHCTLANRRQQIDTGFGPDHVRILLALFNGARTLPAQLESLADQTHRDWSLIVSDDASQDGWLDIMASFAETQAPGRTWLIKGPGKGFARNFLHLARTAGPLVPFAAFCDQDDAWMPDKLARAITALGAIPPEKPALYCGRTVICDDQLHPMRLSRNFQQAPSFGNALVQNIGGGNTMVLNRAALDLVQDTAHLAQGVISHDWWVYQLVSGAGGMVHYDKKPSVLYRQHGGNLVGANDTIFARVARLLTMTKGHYRLWNDANVAALDRARHWLTAEACTTLDSFHIARHGPLTKRLGVLRSAGIYRQTLCGTLALNLAAISSRL